MLGALSTQGILTIQGRRTRPWFLTIAALGGGASVVARSAALTHVMQVDGICTRAPEGTVDAMTGVPRDVPAAIEPNVT